ncbi:hypothetical protein AAHA92_13308 [Salvia divinorum]|uniref:Uncharacterized protein n=1 Tax=Salvia divinorum TaxID=28513 RepID=A0ABD1H7W2_SALDI
MAQSLELSLLPSPPGSKSNRLKKATSGFKDKGLLGFGGFGKPTTSSDVYAFGALLLEVVCGRRPIEAKDMPEELVLMDWVWDEWNEGCILGVVDPRWLDLKGSAMRLRLFLLLIWD